MINFNDLPCDLKSIIYGINKQAEREEKYKDNYNNFVKNFKKRVEGDAEIYNDIIYNWKNQYNHYHLPAYESKCEIFINDYNDIYMNMKDIKDAIDDGVVLNL